MPNPTSYHQVNRVYEHDGHTVIDRITGGRGVDGPHRPGDYIKTEDGRFYQVTEIITRVKVVEDA